jgi:hypothetical protein
MILLVVATGIVILSLFLALLNCCRGFGIPPHLRNQVALEEEEERRRRVRSFKALFGRLNPFNKRRS